MQSAVILLYVSAAIDLIQSVGAITLLLVVGRVAGGWGCANERRWGYQLAVAMALVPFAVILLLLAYGADFRFLPLLISLAFDIVLLALLLHPQSREYQKVWFR